MLNFKKKKDTITLRTEDADQILQAVFEQSKVSPNTTPLEILTSYSIYRKERFALQRIALILILLLFFMLPLLFISPKLTIEEPADTAYTSKPVYKVSVDALLPISSVTATIDGQNIPVYEADVHEYSIEPTMNGRMIVTVTLINHQKQVQHVAVGNVDVDTPLLVSDETDGEKIYLHLSDEASGVDYEHIEAFVGNENKTYPVSFDEESSTVSFDYPEEIMNIYIPDKAGNELHLVLTIK